MEPPPSSWLPPLIVSIGGSIFQGTLRVLAAKAVFKIAAAAALDGLILWRMTLVNAMWQLGT